MLQILKKTVLTAILCLLHFGYSLPLLSQPAQSGTGIMVNRASSDSLSPFLSGADTLAVSPAMSEKHLHDPLMAIQGRLPGLFITKTGSDPNERARSRMRGLHTLINDPEPLFVVDGVPGIPLALVDPYDIASVHIVKDGYAARWGMRAAGGVVEITTRRATAGKPAVRFKSYLAAERAVRMPEVLDAASYTSIRRSIEPSYEPPGTQDNNWSDLITRRALSTVQALSVHGGSDALAYRVSFNRRNAEGPQLETGYDRLNGRVVLRGSLLEDRLLLGLNLAATSEQARYGFEEAFKYAIAFNPSAPSRDDLQGFSQYGGYFQQPLFDYYNPLALVEQNSNDGDDRLASAVLSISYDMESLIDGLSASLALSETRSDLFRGEYYPPDSYYRGLNAVGLARTESDERSDRSAAVTVSWSGSMGDLYVESSAGYFFQHMYHDYLLKQATNISPAQGYSGIDSGVFDGPQGMQRNLEEDHYLSALFAGARIGSGERWYLDLGLRREGSSYLGSENKWGLFPHIGAGIDLTSLLPLPILDTWKLRGSYGETGNLPKNSGWSKAIYSEGGYYFTYQGVFLRSYTQTQAANPDLKRELTKMWNFGLDFTAGLDRLRGTLEFFIHNSSDLMVNADLPMPPFTAPSGYRNMGEITNRGLELSIAYDLISGSRVSYTSELNLSRIRTTYGSLTGRYYTLDETYYGSPTGTCGCSDLLVRVTENDPAGQFYGPVSRGIDSNGQWMVDYNERQVIGNALPSFHMGWYNTVSLNNWRIDLLFRGIFGHELASTTRLLYENRTQIQNYNILESTPAELDDFNLWSDQFVEDGDYFKLDNITISYFFPLGESRLVKKARVFAAADNLIMFTGFSGSDPAVRLSDWNSNLATTMYSQGNLLAPGIERPSSWPASRTLLLGVELEF